MLKNPINEINYNDLYFFGSPQSLVNPLPGWHNLVESIYSLNYLLVSLIT